MIHTLIVDDEHLVRQGLIHTFPWEKFGMQIIGDCDNGETAINMIRELDVKLLITDLTMPLMTGFELLQEVDARYPHIWKVVLTCHQDFDYIQEAIRLGAIDYIVKTQLNKEVIHSALSRIQQRITREEERYSNVGGHPLDGMSSDWGILLRKQGLQDVNILDIPDINLERTVKIDDLTWLVYADNWGGDWKKKIEEVDSSLWSIVVIKELNAIHRLSLEKVLQEYVNRHWFYDVNPLKPYSYQSLGWARTYKEKNGMSQELHVVWDSCVWVFDDTTFEKWLSDIEQFRPLSEHLTGWFHEMIEAWRHIQLIEIRKEQFTECNQFRYWSEWNQWLRGLRNVLLATQLECGCSEELFAIILKSLLRISRQLATGIRQSDVAKDVNLSRSYFSTVFKEISGKIFNEYLRDMRIERAKRLLLEFRNKPIYWVAEQSGFQDEGYFSRVFRECTGQLPSEFKHSSL